MNPRGLSEAIEQAESGAALFVWRVDANSPWRITDWAGVPEPLDTVTDCGRVDLIGPRGVAALVASFRASEDFFPTKGEHDR